jgi:hypothetical protein
MSRSAGRLVALVVVVAVAGCVSSAPRMPSSARVSAVTRPAAAGSTLAGLPISFVENRGQLDPQVAFAVQRSAMSAYFTPGGVTFALVGPQAGAPESGGRAPTDPADLALGDRRRDAGAALRRWAVRQELVGARPAAAPVGLEQTGAIVSYFKGPRERWIVGAPTYASVVYPDAWPGIDVIYAGNGGRLESSFVVKAGGDPGQIRVEYRGASEVRLTETGQLQVVTPVGVLAEDAPAAFQEVDGRRTDVKVEYELEQTAAGDGSAYGLRLGPYDPSLPLVVDPPFLFSGYVGGSAFDTAFGIALDGAGNAYIAGATGSSEASFPVTVGPDLSFNGAASDAFVAKVRADGTGLVYAGYVGGAGNEVAFGIAVDGAGSAYLTGRTDSSETSFPILVGPDPTYNGGGEDAFVVKVRADGAGLEYAGYIGGDGGDRGNGIAVDAAGNAYVAGQTGSSPLAFPVAIGPSLVQGGGGDAFVARVRAGGSGLDYAGYVGGASLDIASGIAVDGAGQAYLVGTTSSDQTTFPVGVGPDLSHNGLDDAFVAKVRADGRGLIYAGYVGGFSADVGTAIAVDAAGSAYITGYTRSIETTFPVTVGPDLTYNGGLSDAFVAKIRADGGGLVYAGYIGGSAEEFGAGIAVDGAGNAYLTGVTMSTEATFPVLNGPGLVGGGSFEDAFVAKVRADGAGLVYAGYIGGPRADGGRGIAVDGAGTAYVAGDTGSAEPTFPVVVGPDLTYNGGVDDAFVARIPQLPSSLATPTPTPTVPPTGTVTATATAAASVTATATVTPTSTPAAPVSSDGEDDRKPKLTEEQRQQRSRTNRSNRDDYAAEGNVVEVRCDATVPTVVIANRDGLLEVRLLRGAAAVCGSIRVGDYLEADGEKQSEQLFDATDVQVRRSARERPRAGQPVDRQARRRTRRGATRAGRGGETPGADW